MKEEKIGKKKPTKILDLAGNAISKESSEEVVNVMDSWVKNKMIELKDFNPVHRGRNVFIIGSDGREVVIPRARPMFAAVLTSYLSVPSSAGLVATVLDNKQTIVAVGDNSTLHVGDVVELITERWLRETKPGKADMGNEVKFIPPLEIIHDMKFLYMNDRDIKYIFE